MPRRGDRPVWAVKKGDLRAETLLRPHPLGLEAVCMIGGELFHSVTFRPHEASVLRQHCSGVRQDFERVGWTFAGEARAPA